MFITAETLAAIQARCSANVEFAMIAYSDLGDGYGLIFGVCGDPEIGRWTPFTMRDGRNDLKMWPTCAHDDPGLAAMAVTKLVDGFMTGSVRDPHLVPKMEQPMLDEIKALATRIAAEASECKNDEALRAAFSHLVEAAVALDIPAPPS